MVIEVLRLIVAFLLHFSITCAIGVTAFVLSCSQTWSGKILIFVSMMSLVSGQVLHLLEQYFLHLRIHHTLCILQSSTKELTLAEHQCVFITNLVTPMWGGLCNDILAFIPWPS